MIRLTWNAVRGHVNVLAQRIKDTDWVQNSSPIKPISLYGVPRGGIPVALMVASQLESDGYEVHLSERPENADFIVDDLVDSGSTRNRYAAKFPKTPFYTLIEKKDNDWIQFPWEIDDTGVDKSAEDIFTRLLQYVGEDVKRGGLLETPARAAKAWKFWTKGYAENPADILKVFSDGGENYDQLVLVRDIPISSFCEHHLAPIFGTAHVGYIPSGKVVGLSKLNRLVDVFARRLQVQERLTSQIADALYSHLEPKGVGVVLECRHFCMESRGVCQQGHQTITSALRGVLLTETSARAEFLSLAQSKKDS